MTTPALTTPIDPQLNQQVLNNDTSYHHDYPGWDVTKKLAEGSPHGVSKGELMSLDAARRRKAKKKAKKDR